MMQRLGMRGSCKRRARSGAWLALAACGVATSVWAASTGGPFRLETSVINNGAARSTSAQGRFTLQGAVGQSVAGVPSQGGAFALAAGPVSPPDRDHLFRGGFE